MFWEHKTKLTEQAEDYTQNYTEKTILKLEKNVGIIAWYLTDIIEGDNITI